VVIHNQVPPGSLNDYETNWGRYERQQPDNTKRHLGMKTGLQGHVHTLPSLRGGPNGWAGEPDVHGMVYKEVVRALLERQNINGLHLLLNRAPAFQQNWPEGLTSTDHEWALHRQRLGDMVPMNALHALVMRCFFSRATTLCTAKEVMVSTIASFLPLSKSRLVWIAVSGIRVGALQGLRGKTLFLPSKQLASRAQFLAPPTSPPLLSALHSPRSASPSSRALSFLAKTTCHFSARHVAGVADNNC